MKKNHFYTIVISENRQENYRNEDWSMKKQWLLFPRHGKMASLQNLSAWWLILNQSWTLAFEFFTESLKPSIQVSVIWTFIFFTDAEAPELWAPDVKSQLIGTDPDDGKDWK